MPFDFDEEFTATDDSPAPEPLPALPELEPEEEVSEVERRLEKAQYYRAIMATDLREDDSESAEEVQREIKAFIRERMAVLVGATPGAPSVAPASPFTRDETMVLKQLARKFLKIGPAPEVAKPVAAPAKVAPKPVTKPAKLAKAAKPVKGLKKAAPEEVLTIKDPQSGVDITYRKVTDARGTCYVDSSGNRFTLATNGAGESYMRSEAKQAVSLDTKPLPAVQSHQYQIIAQQHAAAAVQGASKLGVLAQAIQHAMKE
jgi:hypothetical protein